MKNPLVLLSLLLMIACQVDGRSIEENANDILTQEGEPGWIEEVIKEAKAENENNGKREHYNELRSNELDAQSKRSFGFSINDDNDGGDDILTSEGQPGWIEEVLEQAKSQFVKNEEAFEEGKQKRAEGEPIPEGAVAKLKASFERMGDKAKGALSGLNSLKGKWTGLSIADRAAMAETLQSVTSDFQQIANAGSDPLEALKGGINVIAQFAALAGPQGQIFSEALSFVSGFLSLLGQGGGEKSIGDIVREEIDKALDKFRQQDLISEARGVSDLFDDSKIYVDSLAQQTKTLTKDQALLLAINVPLYSGLKFMGKLMSEIESLISKNWGEEHAQKALTYIELYTKMATLKDMIVLQTAALLPDELAINREALIKVQLNMRRKQKNLLKFLYESDVTNKIMPYFDPDKYPITDSYLSKGLGVENYDRKWAGTYCLTPAISGEGMKALTWSRVWSKLMVGSYPYVTIGEEGCFWKLIPHGKRLFTIQNRYQCPSYDHCGEYLAFDSLAGSWTSKFPTRADVKNVAMLWEIVGNNQKRIRIKWSCGSSDPKWCDMQLKHQRDKADTITFGVTKDNVGYIWYLTEKPMY